MPAYHKLSEIQILLISQSQYKWCHWGFIWLPISAQYIVIYAYYLSRSVDTIINSVKMTNLDFDLSRLLGIIFIYKLKKIACIHLEIELKFK